MSLIRFVGRLFPMGTKLSLDLPQIRQPIQDRSYAAVITTNLVDSKIEIICDLPVPLVYEDIGAIYVTAVTIAQGIVNLVALRMGAGVIVNIEHWIDEEGYAHRFHLGDPNLPQHCTAITNATFPDLLKLLVAEPELHMVLNDLNQSQLFHNYAVVNCGRAVEGLRHMIAGPGLSRAQEWSVMRDALNLDQSFITFITDHSISPRHGEPSRLPGPTTQLITERAWMIADRFLHYRLGGNQPLREPNFPMLTV